MQTYVSMLRGINVSGQKKIKMADLKELYESFGFENVQTYIQSGNVVFSTGEAYSAGLTARIELGIVQEFGFEVKTILRTRAEIHDVRDHNPLLPERAEHTKYMAVTFLTDEPAIIPHEEIEKARSDPEEWIPIGREVYLYFPNGFAKTRLTNNFLEKKLKVSATTRNWRTVNKLHELANTVSVFERPK